MVLRTTDCKLKKKKMEVQHFDKILMNCDILIRIYKLLKFHDQLNLSRINAETKNIFENFIWKEKYRVMIIKKISENNDVLIKGAIGTQPLRFTIEEFKRFFHYYADQIEDLTLDGALDLIKGVNLQNLNKFEHKGILREPLDVEMMTRNWPNLKELHLNGLFMLASQNLDSFGKDLKFKVKVDSPLKALRLFCMHQANTNTLDYMHFQKILSHSNLKCLKINSIIKPNKNSKDLIERSDCINLQELEVKTTFDPAKWLDEHFSSFLKNFENLQTLSIKFCDILTDETFATLRRACKNLEKLTIQDSTFGPNANCILPTKLKELSVCSCKNVTGLIVKQMLAIPGDLTKFYSRWTVFKEFKDFKISPNIRILDTNGVNSLDFKSAFEGNTNLKELTWHGPFYGENDDGTWSSSALHTCLNLEVLNTLNHSVPLSALLQLKHLRKLFISESSKFYNWSYLIGLLKHLPLRELIIDKVSYRSILWEDPNVPVSGFSTNVELITFDVRTFKVSLDFWLELLRENVKLKIVCTHFELDCQRFIEKLIDHESFPSDIKTIDVWGNTQSK